MEVSHYQHLRECELEAALAESRAEIASGRFVVESPAQHVARLQAMIADEAATGTVLAPAPAIQTRGRRTPTAAPNITPAKVAKRQAR